METELVERFVNACHTRADALGEEIEKLKKIRLFLAGAATEIKKIYPGVDISEETINQMLMLF